MAFNTHRLNMEEVWYAREHKFDVRVVKVKKLVAELDALEDQVETKQKELDAAVNEMNMRRWEIYA